MTKFRPLRVSIALLFIFWLTGPCAIAKAEETRIAVAANFTEPAKEIGALFERTAGHRLKFSFASTGQLYAQIALDAPFDVFLAADQKRAALAAEHGFALAATQFTYAKGHLALYGPELDLSEPKAVLEGGNFSFLAIANPETAPYGAAAVETMTALGLFDALKPKLVRGNNIAQAYQFVISGNAELGFVALSQVIGKVAESYWRVPDEMYRPIAQDAILLKKGENNKAARAFLRFLKGEEAKRIKARFGYE